MYIRVENFGEYSHITTIAENGKYKQIVKWQDGTITSCYENTIVGLGWDSITDFINHRPGFKRYEN